ncbi:hypothetical protein GQ54DRAFT_299387 [Martensiomyces pterosporus]|nr:hypothetical protein GQ54DRAFT_299387 [Martensiomyces pterosporus]
MPGQRKQQGSPQWQDHVLLLHRRQPGASYSTQHALAGENCPGHNSAPRRPPGSADQPVQETRDEVVELLSTAISTSSVISTVRECRQKYPKCVLLVRVGDFYELYFDQADDVGGDILGLQVVDKRFRNGAVRFTGFPARSLDRYIEILVGRHGKSVALCEQFQEPLRRSFTRKVTRVITPGTMIDNQYVADTKVYSYILCIAHLDPGHEEYARQMDIWRHERALAEKKYKEEAGRIIAEARRKWQKESDEVAASKQKRRRGRPKKMTTVAIESLAAPVFDPDSVPLPEPPEIPPPPSFVSRLGDAGSLAADSKYGTLGDDTKLGLAWLDLATGDFMTCISTPSSLSSDLARIRPKEILIEKENPLVKSLVSGTYPSVLAAIQAAGQPSVTEVPQESFLQWRTADPEHLQGDRQPSDSVDSVSSLSSGNGGTAHSPNVSWQLSAPSKNLVTSPEHLVLEAAELSNSEQAASRALLNYILDTQLGLLPPLQPPKRYKVEGHMRMSAATIQALELLRPLNDDQMGSSPTLLSEIDYTRTSAGGRLLAKRLTAPSTSVDIIEQRLDLVEFFTTHKRARELIRERLDGIGDVERAVNKLSLNCGGPHDLLDISRTLREVTKIKAILASVLNDAEAGSNTGNSMNRWRIGRRQGSSALHRARSTILDVARRKKCALQSLTLLMRDIESKIREDAERDVRIFGFLKPNCIEKITNLHEQLQAKETQRRELQEMWRSTYECSSLKLDSIPALGHFIEVSKRDSARLLDSTEFRMIQSLKSKVRFENAQWTYLLSEIETLRNLIQAEEMRVFEELRDGVLEASSAIRTNCKVLADLDVAISMAVLASSHQYTRPRFVGSHEGGSAEPHLVVNGRHPVVESQLLAANRQYVGNDCAFNNGDSQVLLLTGPNMGGKSTYLRQIALTSVLAQIGSFVPADDAQLHVVDAIYSRIGAHDNLALDQSTFMVEMTETADILRHATGRSLVILDEIGRGTSTTDGISIAYATLKYLHDRVRCKAVFATHYHELVPHVVPGLDGIKPIHTAIYEDGAGGFAFLHKVKPGICNKSHGLYVAQIAGIPEEVLKTARQFASSKCNI